MFTLSSNGHKGSILTYVDKYEHDSDRSKILHLYFPAVGAAAYIA